MKFIVKLHDYYTLIKQKRFAAGVVFKFTYHNKDIYFLQRIMFRRLRLYEIPC